MKPANSGMKLITAGLIVIKDRRLLLAYSNNKQAFYLPGGKADEGETTLQALIREVREELNLELDPNRLGFYSHVTAPAFGEKPGITMEQDCYLSGLTAEPIPSSEIGAIEYFDTHSYKTQPQQVPGVIQVMKQLQQDGLID